MIARMHLIWQRTGLGLRILAMAVLVLLLSFMARNYLIVLEERAQAQARYDEELTEARRLLTPILRARAEQANQDAVRDILRVEVRVREDVDLIRWKRQGADLTERDPVAWVLRAPPWFVALTAIEPIESTEPLVSGDPSLGELTLHTTPVPVLNRLWDRFLVQAPLLGLLALLMLTLVWLMLRRSLATLNELALAARRLQQGDMAVRIAAQGAPEFVQVAKAFNAMADKLGVLLPALVDSEAKSRVLFESAHDPVMLVRGNRFLDVNAATLQQLGYASRQEFLQRKLDEISPERQPDGRLSVEKRFKINVAALASGYQRFDWVHLKKDGSPLSVEVTLTLIHVKDEVIHHVAWRDISGRLAQERAIAAAQAQMQATLDAIPDQFFEIALDGTVHSYHAPRSDGQALPAVQYVGKNLREVMAPEMAQVCQLALEEANLQGHSQGQRYALQLDSGKLWFELSVAQKLVEAGQEPRFILLARDITERQQRLEAASWQAGHDALTGLPNRILLGDRFARATSSTLRQQCLLAVCMLDLDGFKPVNDTYGHDVGDQLLLEVSARLSRCMRGEDTVARLGGDEFVLLLGDLKDTAETELMLQRIQAEIAAPYFLADEPIQVSASIGVTVYPLDDADPDTLLRHADLAMFQAKQAGRNRHEIFNVAQDQQGQNYRQLAQRVQQALENSELRLFYQPKVNMRSGDIVGMEALIRWQHPERGLLAPAEFLPLVEHSRLMVDIGDWVMHQALDQAQRWCEAGQAWPVSVNIAPRHFQHPQFLSRLRDLLGCHALFPPQMLELEIVESAALGEVQHVAQLIADCQSQLGVRFALGDFGTGYSSLTYLKRLRVDTFKIDQSFVRDILSDREDLALVEGVIGLAMVFDRALVAEGVETAAHGALLLRLGCEVAQGYGIARPMPADQVLAWAAQYLPDPSWSGL